MTFRVANLTKLTSFVFTTMTLTPLHALVTPSVTPGFARFPEPTASININSNSDAYKKVWKTAINDWNRTETFKFQLTNSMEADVIAGTSSSYGNNYSGMTYSKFTSLGSIQHVDAYINPKAFKIYSYSTKEKVIVAQHELGHALGLSHNQARKSVMYKANRNVIIQDVDIKGVHVLYSSHGNRVIGPRSQKFYDPIVVKTDVHKTPAVKR
ncbi:M57 family metalloprotease [Lentilactobacillus sp. Marseille-Q4993]|uniref:M57 family metalloprotease n=1 Tax=Lentilactobacillus sp. Marseille-Q4993 TaxID=3039492 RepID=UPI0024BD4CCF|nr:M57 family metalloprotease [Lentilactobacillus sp. Marseille-Q4993]